MYPQHRLSTPDAPAAPRSTASEPATRAALDWADRRGGIPASLLHHAAHPLVWDGGVLSARAYGGGFVRVELAASEPNLTITLSRGEEETDLSILTVPASVLDGSCA